MRQNKANIDIFAKKKTLILLLVSKLKTLNLFLSFTNKIKICLISHKKP